VPFDTHRRRRVKWDLNWKSCTRIYHQTGLQFHNWIDYNGVAFSRETLQWFTIQTGMLYYYRDFQPWGKPYLHTWKITIVFHVFEIAYQLLTYHSLYLVPWMNYNAFSFWNMNKVNFFLLVRSLYNKQNTCLLGDMEFLSSCSTWYLTWSLHTLVRHWVEHLKNHLVKWAIERYKEEICVLHGFQGWLRITLPPPI